MRPPAITLCDRVAVFLRTQRVTEIGNGILCGFLRRDELGAHQLEIHAIRNQAVRQFINAVFDVGDAVACDRVRAQIARCIASSSWVALCSRLRIPAWRER